MGVRPLVLGKLGSAYILASETVGLDIIGADKVRDLAPGEMVVIDEDGLHSHFPFAEADETTFLHLRVRLLFARPDSVVESRKSVYAVHASAIGAELARENPMSRSIWWCRSPIQRRAERP